MGKIADTVIGWTERGLVPDSAIRAGVRRLLEWRLNEIGANDNETASRRLSEFAAQMRTAVVAPLPKLANEQHYEVPSAFFAQVLGSHRKYSCCYWPDGVHDLDEAESEALKMTCERAGIENGMSILDLGCGWGSLSLWIARHYPQCHITSVSNSNSQRNFIAAAVKDSGLTNVSVLTHDMNDFVAPSTFDRVVSVEMFEHMRNYEVLFGRINQWLNPGGQFFMHIFCHRLCAYAFEDGGPSDWMSRHFFSGGIMPSADLPLHFQRDLRIKKQWRWDGRHYEKTANAWLANMDANKLQLLPILADTYGTQHAQKWWQRWRMFFIACAELFGYTNGQQWFVSHYLFSRQEDT